MKQVPLVVREASEGGVVRDPLEQAAPACRGTKRVTMSAQVHERVHEPDAAAAALAHRARTLEPVFGTAIGLDRPARAAQAAQHVAAQAPQFTAPQVVPAAQRGAEADDEGSPRPFRLGPAQLLDPRDQPLGGTHGREPRHSSVGMR